MPSAFPRYFPSVASAISASLAAHRTPSPTLSRKRAASTKCHEAANARRGFEMVERLYPKITWGFLFPDLSDIQPEITFMMLAVLSAMPSINPTIVIGAPRTVVRNIGIIGYNISLLISVKKLTRPSMNTFFFMPFMMSFSIPLSLFSKSDMRTSLHYLWEIIFVQAQVLYQCCKTDL